MKASEYFGDWMDVIDTAELRKILSWISTIDKTTLCPSSPNIFKAFRSCPLKDCKVVFQRTRPVPTTRCGYWNIVWQLKGHSRK